MFHIYQITNTVTNKSYIGKTSQKPRYRYRSHMTAAKNGRYNQYFHNSIRKYGEECFVLKTLEIFKNESKCYEREKYWIEKKNTLSPDGYNSNAGGKGGMFNPSEETRKKMSDAKEGFVPWNKGLIGVQKHSDKTKLRMSKAKIGKKPKPKEKCIFDTSRFGMYYDN